MAPLSRLELDTVSARVVSDMQLISSIVSEVNEAKAEEARAPVGEGGS